jgi:transposase
MDVLVERCAGLDVHKDSVVACIRLPGPEGGRRAELHTFGTTTAELLALRDWLCAHQVSLVGMESTGVYWRPVYYLLEEAMTCWLLNARHLRNVPGRKTDAADAAWIAELVEHGLVSPSFVPPKPIRELRDLTRYRKAQIQERSREAQRLDKILQDAGIKLSSVATDVLGVSGRAMLATLVAGGNDPDALAELARGRLRTKIPALREALTGRFSTHHALMAGEILAKLDYLDEAIGRLSAEIETRLAPFARQLELLDTITGINRRTGEGLLAETGVDMSVFPSAAHLASWAGRCPGQHESAGKRSSGKTRNGPRWLRLHLHDAALAASRSKHTYLGAQYRRLKARRGHAKALVAVEHSLLVIIYHMLSRDEPYHDLGADYVTRRDPIRRGNQLLRQLRELGYDIAITAEPTTA